VLQKPARHWRVKRFRFPLSFSSQLVISLRRFRTNRNQRSKRYKQVVFRLNLLSLREVAIAKTKRKASARRRPKPTILWLPRRALVPLLFVALATNAAAYYAISINKPAKLEASVYKPVPVSAVVDKPKPLSPPLVMPHSQPTSLSIPAIQVNTELLTLGRQPDGEIEMPSYPDKAGWYQYGPTPGELGPAVIVGHLDTWNDVAVFWRLHELKPGDEIDVSRADGTTAKFSVTANQQLPRDNFPTQQVYGNIDYAGIRLVTCGGAFNSQTMKYAENTVVYGKLNQQ
jgi:sortase (surface protein transpeptidase)